MRRSHARFLHPCYPPVRPAARRPDRKSTRLNSSHLVISYAVFCLKKKKKESSRPYHPLDQLYAISSPPRVVVRASYGCPCLLSYSPIVLYSPFTTPALSATSCHRL